jgi:hypothetical protein
VQRGGVNQAQLIESKDNYTNSFNPPYQENLSYDYPCNRQSDFKFLHISEIEATAPEYIIDQYFEKDTLCMIFGPSAVGKTFTAVDIMCCTATGTEFHGFEIKKQGPCIYICGEGKNSIKRRFDAWSKTHDFELTNAPIFISQTAAHFCEPEHTSRVAESVKSVAKEYGQPVLIIIDTLARNFGPGDENSTKDMSAFIQAMDQLREQYNSTILIIHHTGHTEQSRSRGSSALKAALDAEFRMKKDNGIIRLEATKMKDADLPETMTFKLKTVELDIIDDHGHPVRSVVLESIECGNGASSKQKLGKNQYLALDVLKRLYDGNRQQLEKDGLDLDLAKVKVDTWKEELEKEGLDRKAFCSVKKSLPEKHLVRIENDFAYLVS